MRRIAVLAATAAFAFAGCGGDDDEPESAATPAATEEATEAPTEAPTEAATEEAGGEALAIAADPGGDNAFTETELTAAAGSVTIEFANESSKPHAVTIEGDGVNESTETVTGADAPPLTVELAAGEYTFYCPVGNHRADGMEGKLVVQ
jgi:plastocyanin